MRTRTSPSDLSADAVAAFEATIRPLGLEIAETKVSGGRPRITIVPPSGPPLVVEVTASTTLPNGFAEEASRGGSPGVVRLVVADRVPDHLRTALNSIDHGWLDRRGHLRLVGKGIFIDADVPSSQREAVTAGPSAPISGRSGLAAAAGILMRPDDPMGVSEIARFASLNPSSISRALASIEKAQLAEQVGRGRYRPLVPELFWALAEAWPRDRTATGLGSRDLARPSLRVEPDDLDAIGWAVAGERAGVAWGVPLVLTGDFPLFVYVPDAQSVRAALAQGGTQPEGTTEPAITLAVDPTGLIVSHRLRPSEGDRATAHPLFCALDIAASSRDREALEQWTPRKEFVRVW